MSHSHENRRTLEHAQTPTVSILHRQDILIFTHRLGFSFLSMPYQDMP